MCLPVDVPGRLPIIDQAEKVGADLLRPEVVGLGVAVAVEVGDPAGVGLDRLGGAGCGGSGPRPTDGAAVSWPAPSSARRGREVHPPPPSSSGAPGQGAGRWKDTGT